jgi:hypothetical protein
MTNTRKQLILIALCVLSFGAEIAMGAMPNLKPGVIVNDSTLDQLSTTSIPYAVAMCGWSANCDESNAVDVIGFTNLGSGNIYYSLGGDMKIRSFDIAKKTDLGAWPINRSKDEYIESDFISRINNFQSDLSLGWTESDSTTSLGCLGAYPLRYGDIDGDGHPELVLLLNDDFMVFSLANDEIVFSAPLKLDDWLDTSESQAFISHLGGAADAVPQYQSRIAADSLARMQVVLPGQRGYAKLYFGDFNGDGKPDIVVWRKFYVSLMQSDTTKGFKLVSDTYLLYSLENGVYAKQSTDQSAIKGWLAAKSLTWQKGYPQTSECADQAGKPIPEMDDPLLNDPDVLK